MVVYNDLCVGCPAELGCLGRSCPYLDVPETICDICGEHAMYMLDGDDYCEQCAYNYLMDIVNSLTITELADALDVECCLAEDNEE